MARAPVSDPASDTPNMVLRTVYLPVAMDEDLKNAALLTGRSKNDLIRELCAAGLAKGTAAARALAESRGRTIAPAAVKAPERRSEAAAASGADRRAEAKARLAKAVKDLLDDQSRAQGMAGAGTAPTGASGDDAARVSDAVKAARAMHQRLAALGLDEQRAARERKAAADMAADRRARQLRKAMLRAGKKGTRSGKGLDA